MKSKYLIQDLQEENTRLNNILEWILSHGRVVVFTPSVNTRGGTGCKSLDIQHLIRQKMMFDRKS